MASQGVPNPIVWVDIPCVDLSRAITFYEAVLDCEIIRENSGGFSMGLFHHGDSSAGGCLAVMDDVKPSDQGVMIYLNCEGRLDAAITAAREKGAVIQKDKHSIGPHGFRAVIVDSEGNRIALHSF